MAEQPARQHWAQVGQRRSQRVLLRLAVTIEGTSAEEKQFQEDTHTLVVNAHGCLVLLRTQLKPGQSLLLTNNATREKQECRVAYQGKMQDAKQQVALEFQHPLPDYWGIAFPPEDWKVPAE
jgi:hypothetical protein